MGLSVKYVLDRNHSYINEDNAITRLCRIIKQAQIPIVSTSLGFFDNKIEHSDSVIKMRNIKSKAGCDIKVYISSSDVSDIASYVKAGADIIGLPWNKAPYLVHAYEDLVQRKT
jgi:deoxyribose-phosphate aldolase